MLNCVWTGVEEVFDTRHALATFCCSFETAMMYVGIDVMRPMSQSSHVTFHDPARSALSSTSARDVWGLNVVRDQQQDLQVLYVLMFAHICFPCILFVCDRPQSVIGTESADDGAGHAPQTDGR